MDQDFFLIVQRNFNQYRTTTLGVDDPYLLGILNSRLFWFALVTLAFHLRPCRAGTLPSNLPIYGKSAD